MCYVTLVSVLIEESRGSKHNSGRPELLVNKVSAVRLREAKGRLSYKRGGEELKGKNKSENRRERARSLNLPFHLYN
jgi:hypothetical protein